MGIVNRFKNKVVFLDTSPLIYYIEGHSKYQESLQKVFRSNDLAEFQFITSTLTLLEVIVHPLKLNQQNLADQYENILTTSETIEIVELSTEIAKRSAQLRVDYNLKTPDAIQVATALEKNADYFFTNDKGLKKIREVEVITLTA